MAEEPWLPGMIGSTKKCLCEYFVVIEHKGVVKESTYLTNALVGTPGSGLQTRENHCRWLLSDDILSLGTAESLWFAKLGYCNDFP